jgi:hypothetical protein
MVSNMPLVSQVQAIWTAFDTEAMAEVVKLSDKVTVTLKRK